MPYDTEIIERIEKRDKIPNGTCLLCGDECNPLSQSCGTCARKLSNIIQH